MINNDGELSEISLSTLESPTFVDSTTCKCSNFVWQAHYKITYQEWEEDNQFYPTAAEVQFVLGEVEIDKSVGTCEAQIDQRFVYKYVHASDTEPIYQSGNPGYINDRHLILGLESSGSVLRNVNGVRLSSRSDTDGVCTATGLDNIDTSLEEAIRYNWNMTVSCNYEFVDYAEFTSFCENANSRIKQLDIFKDLDNFNRVAQFGRPNVDYPLVSV